MERTGVFLIVLFLFSSGISTTISEQVTLQSDVSATVFDTLIGPLPTIVKKNKNPYLVPSNIEVPPDRTVTIEPGTVFLFKNFSGLHVRGKLLARGTAIEPIIFSSENDKNYNNQAIRDANPFDWDGIYMTGDAMGSQFTNCNISYSVYCISSATKLIRLDPLSVKENGKNVITIEDKEYPLNDSTFSYVIDKKDALQDGIPIELIRDPIAKKRTIFRGLGVVFVAGGLGSAIYFGTELYKANSQFDKLSDTAFVNTNPNKSDDWKMAKNKTTNKMLLCSSGALVTLIGLVCFSWTFTF